MNEALKHEETLIERIKADDQQAFTQFYDSYVGRLTYFIYQFIKDYEESITIANETFTKLWALRKNFNELSDVRAYMYVTARNASYDHLRFTASKQRIQEIPSANIDELDVRQDADESMMNAVLETEFFNRMYREIANLPERQKEILEMVLQEKSYADIAAVLDINEDAARQLKKRAIDNLRKKLIAVYPVFLFYFFDRILNGM